MFSFNTLRNLTAMIGLACGSLICSNAALASGPKLDVVVYGGLDNSPPDFPGLYWNLASGFSNSVIDDSGKIAFVGTIFGEGINLSNNRVMYYGDAGGWTKVARNGDTGMPGLPGLTLLNINSLYPALTPNGNIVVSSSLAGKGVTASNDSALWIGTVDSQTLIVQEGATVAPGGAVITATFNQVTNGNNIRTNNAGQVLFNSNLVGGDVVGTTNNFGVYIGSASGITEVARKGNPIPGAPALPDPSGPFMTPDSFGLFLNGAGEVMSTGTLVAGTAGGVTGNDDKVVYTTVGGPLRIAARENDPVPGMELVKYKAGSSFSTPAMGITNGGKILFSATLDNIVPGTSVTAANDTAWLVDDHGTVSLMIREGDAIDGETFNFINSGGSFLNNNDVAFIAGTVLGGSNTARLWTGPLGGPYTKIVEQGVTTVPGQPDVILDFAGSSANIAVNNADQVVFQSNLVGPGVTPFIDDRGVFGWSADTGLVLIARTGPKVIAELLEVAQLALIGGTGITGENGSAILTDNGWLTFRMQDVKGFQAIIRTRPFDPTCDGDINANGTVDVDDLLIVINSWGIPSGAGDITGDGAVDVDDLLVVINGWGNCQ